jgi:trans-aconitate methyltransferase
MIDGAGAAVRDDKGKIRYVPLLEWLDKDAADKFSQAVIEAVEREYPGATEGEYGN